MVDLASLVLPMQAGVGFQPDEEIVEHCRVGVYGTVQEADLSVARIHLTQPSLELIELLGV